MAKQKRYTAKLDLYIYARNDREAMVRSAKLAEFLRKEFGNEAQILTVDETPFASCCDRRVHTGRLTLFENKLIEVPYKDAECSEDSNLSPCCGAEIIFSDLCSECKEHC